MAEMVHEGNKECTLDGTVDKHGRPAVRRRTGSWVAASLILVNQGLATLAFFGVGANLVLFLTRVMGQHNSEAANNISNWTGTVYIFSLLGAFLSDSYWGRYKTCIIFQTIFVVGLISLSLSSHILLVNPIGSHSNFHKGMCYVLVYLIALGYGGYQPNIATFGADQFDEQHPKERHSKVTSFSYFYLAFNLGSLFSDTILVYVEDKGSWTLGFWASTGCAIIGLFMFLIGTPRYRHFIPIGNPLFRFCHVLVAAIRKWKVEIPSKGEELYEAESIGGRKILHTQGFKFLDRAAVIGSNDILNNENIRKAWNLCTVTEVEEVKCIFRLVPIWMCTIVYSMVYIQMASLFVEQGASMKTIIVNFHIPPASMSSFDILSVIIFFFIYKRVIDPFMARPKETSSPTNGLTELQRMGVGLVLATMGMVAASTVEHFRLKQQGNEECLYCQGSSSLSIFWQVPQYIFIGASEVFMNISQLEFFNGQAPDGLKSFGSALFMSSISLGNYLSSLLVTIVMKISSRDTMPGWIPQNLNKGHLDKFYFLLAILTVVDLIVYIVVAKWYKYIKFEGRSEDESHQQQLDDIIV